MRSSLEQNRERSGKRRAVLTGGVVAEGAAHRRTVDVDQLQVQADVPCIKRVEVHAGQILGRVTEARILVAEDLRGCAVELDLLRQRIERGLNVVATIENRVDR